MFITCSSYDCALQKRRQYPYDGLVKELSGTDDQTYAVRDKSSTLLHKYKADTFFPFIVCNQQAIPKDARGGPADEEQEEEE